MAGGRLSLPTPGPARRHGSAGFAVPPSAEAAGARLYRPAAALFAVALTIRLVGIDWHGTHPDENIGAAAKVLTGRLSVSSYYPPLLDYLTAVAFAALYALGRLLSWWGSTAEFRDAYLVDPTPFHVTARAVVATLSAAAAPLALWLVSSAGLRAGSAFLVGLLVAIVPGSVFWAHIAKQDGLLAPAFLFLAIAGFRFVDTPRSGRSGLVLALALALAVSVKHSAIFFAIPFLAILLSRSVSRDRYALAAWAKMFALALVLWAPLNIGILLDSATFLNAQRVQSQMSVRQADFTTTATTFIASMTDGDAGLPLALVGMWLLHPVMLLRFPTALGPAFRDRLLVLFATTLSAIVIVASITGARQPSYLWLPYSTLMVVSLAGTATAYLNGFRSRPARVIAGAGLAAMAAILAMQVASILRQSLLRPQAELGARAIRAAAPSGSRIVSALDLSRFLPITPEGRMEARARHERLARKYGVTLSPAQSRGGRMKDPGYSIVPLPVVFGGLEDVDPDVVRTVVAFAWPLQPEEWRLAHWRERRFRFLLLSKAGLVDPVPAYRRLHREVDRDCRLVHDIPGRRPLFWETDARLYDCRPA